MNLGTASITALYLGSTAISTVYLGSTQVYSAGGAFSPLSLFASGEEGAWYEPSPTSTFTDIGGYTFATYGQTVSHLIDKSQGATIEARRNLLLRTEEFDNAAWLTFGGASKTGTNVAEAPDSTISADSIRLASADTASNVYQTFSVGLPVSTELTFSVWVKRNAATDQTFQLFQNVRGATPFGRSGDLVATDTWQRFTFSHSEAGGTGASVFGIIGNVAGTQADLLVWGAQLEAASSATAYQKITDGQTVSWLPGNHATQTNADARPILARVPEGGRRNLFERTEEFDNGYWNASETVTTPTVTLAASELDPTGNSGTVYRLQASAGSSWWMARFEQLPNTTYTISFWVKSASGSNESFRLAIDSGNPISADLTATASWQRFTLSGLATRPSSGLHGLLRDSADNASDLYIWGAQLELGSSATAYQKVVDQYDITEAGVTSLDYLSFDGADDWFTLDYPADQRTSDMTYLLGMEQGGKSTTQFILTSVAATDTPYVIVYADGDTSTIINNLSGSSTTHVNNSTSLADRNAVFDAANTGSPVVLESRGFDMTTSGWVGEVATIGQYRALSFNPEMKMFNMLILANHTSGQISDGRQWVADQIGATLA